MEYLTDQNGKIHELIPVKNGRVRLQSKDFPDIGNTYTKKFIESAIQGGLLLRVKDDLPKDTNVLKVYRELGKLNENR